MRRVLVLFLCVTFFGITLASAQTTPLTPNCVRAKLTGNATTYNPFIPGGWKTGGGQTATGAMYNPNGWEAALQLDLAKQYGCGYGSKRTCKAIVEVPETGLAAILVINDNGPMCADPATAARAPDCRSGGRFARIIDLNERAMRELSRGKSGNNSGMFRNVTVTLLSCDFGQVGLLNAKSQFDLVDLQKIAPTPLPNTPVPTGYDSPFGLSVRPAQLAVPTQMALASQYGMPTNTSSFGGGLYPQGVQSPLNFSSGFSNTPSSQPITSTPAPTVRTGVSASRIIAQPQKAAPGDGILVSWTSVNMEPFSCTITKNGEEFARGNEGSKNDTMNADSVTYTAKCTTAKGEVTQSSATVTVR